jgi:hypothetical protein
MKRRDLLLRSAALSLVPLYCRYTEAQPTSPAFAPVLTASYDNNRTSWNARENVLNQDNVRQRGIRRYYSFQMEGDARGSEAQTLIVPNVTTRDGLRHDIAIQASMSDGLWAFDAGTGEVLWTFKLGRPIKGSKAFDMYQTNDNFGILSTPVVDPDTNIIYLVVWTSPDRTLQNARYMARAIKASDGSDAAPPLDLSGATFNPGHGLPSMKLGTVFRKQRAGLALIKTGGQKSIIAMFAAGAESSSDNHGWVLALLTAPFRVAAVWNNSPHYQGGGIWMAGQAPATDDDGNIYFVAGNGAFDGVTEFGECCTKLHYTPPASSTTMGSLQAVQWFARFTDPGRAGLDPASVATTLNAPRPSNEMLRMPEGDAPVNALPDAPKQALAPPAAGTGGGWTDQDEGSAGVLRIEQFHLLLYAGKDGILTVLDERNLGNTKLSDFATPDGIRRNYAKAKSIIWWTFFPGFDISPTPTDLTQLNIDFAQRTHHAHSTPVFYVSQLHGPMVFCCGENGPVRAWQINAQGQLTFLAYSDEIASPNAAIPSGGMPGGFMSISDGQAQNSALLVCCFPYGNANKEVTGGFFVVYDPEHFDTRPDGSKRLRPLWRSQDWNIQYLHSKFNRPVQSGGLIFIPTGNDRTDVYGLA